MQHINHTPVGKPPAEIAIDKALVRDLISTQHPDLACEPLEFFSDGWDNITFRLGPQLLVRLPRREAAAQLVEHEQTWLPYLARYLPLPIPVPLRTGVAGLGYPWPWSIVPFLSGVPLDHSPLVTESGAPLGAFLRALHNQAIPSEAPHNPVRGVQLAERQEAFERLAKPVIESGLLPTSLESEWREALLVKIDADKCWIHGDLHALNVLADEGVLSAVIDWGDICAGDPATDLAALWSLLPNQFARDAALEAYGSVSAATLVRARAWAIYFGVAHLSAGLVNAPRHVRVGMEIFRNLL